MQLHFEHPHMEKDLVMTGPNDIQWAYNLNTANFPTYGGEVIQILSVYIDDLHLSGEVRTYKKLEEIYSFFAEYMVIASQGSDGKGNYDQTPMKLTYAERNWTFSIQPLSVPGFTYSTETVAPRYQLQAHIKDETAGNYQTLKEMTEITKNSVLFNAKGGGEKEFKLKGIINPAAADPTRNPFSTPVTKTFQPPSKSETEKSLKAVADYYNELLPAYLEGNYENLKDNIDASKPALPKGLSEEKHG